jgi:hypothetical protein
MGVFGARFVPIDVRSLQAKPENAARGIDQMATYVLLRMEGLELRLWIRLKRSRFFIFDRGR